MHQYTTVWFPIALGIYFKSALIPQCTHTVFSLPLSPFLPIPPHHCVWSPLQNWQKLMRNGVRWKFKGTCHQLHLINEQIQETEGEWQRMKDNVCFVPLIVTVNNQQVWIFERICLQLHSHSDNLLTNTILKGNACCVSLPLFFFPPLCVFFLNNGWRLKEMSPGNLSILLVNNAAWNLMAWVILGSLYTHISFQWDQCGADDR